MTIFQCSAGRRRLLDDRQAGHAGADHDEALRPRRRTPRDGLVAPAHRLQAYGDGLQLGLGGGRIDGADRQRVERAGAGAGVQRAPVKRCERDAGRQRVVEAHGKARRCATRGDARLPGVLESGGRGIQRMHGERRDPRRRQQRRRVAGSRHRVPLVGDAAGGQQDRELGVGDLGGVGVGGRREARSPVGGREAPVGVQPGRSRVLVDGLRGARPLHPALTPQPLV
jgi:hypothetical protein